MHEERAIFAGGRWHAGLGEELVSRNPARNAEPVWIGRAASEAQLDQCVEAAQTAWRAWARAPYAQRLACLQRLDEVLARRAGELAMAVTLEMGKPLRESLAEAKSLPGKVAASARAQERLPDLALPQAPGTMQWRPHGVMAIIGPFNYPIHLVHTHLAPALLMGNAVVVKASEITPLSLRIYTEILHECGVPDGVINLVQGTGSAGASLVRHPGVNAVAFTGSWATGRRIAEAALDSPSKLLALEMGGKNIAVVLDDAHLPQTLHEVVLGACLTTGQRCTATSRVIVSHRIADRFIAALNAALERVRPGDPLSDDTLMGPLATEASRARFLQATRFEQGAGVTTLLAAEPLDGGSFVTPSLHLAVPGNPAADAYVDTELFAPDIAVEIATSDDEALERCAASKYGLSLSVFSADHRRFQRFVHETHAGVFNWNRSTNNATGLLPFGGTGYSGNHRPAGSAAALYCGYPQAVLQKEHGAYESDPRFGPLLGEALGAQED
jgi:succinylglutamic semialdehyde dehydrogenase